MIQQSPKKKAHERSRIRKVAPQKNSVKTFGQNFPVKTLLGPKPYTISTNPKP